MASYLANSCQQLTICNMLRLICFIGFIDHCNLFRVGECVAIDAIHRNVQEAANEERLVSLCKRPWLNASNYLCVSQAFLPVANQVKGTNPLKQISGSSSKESIWISNGFLIHFLICFRSQMALVAQELGWGNGRHL
jgi:hypothetical protein